MVETAWRRRIEPNSRYSSAEFTLYLVDRETVQFGQFLLPLFLILPVIVFCFACKYSWAAINVRCIYQKWTLDVLCKTKQIKEKHLEIYENEFVLILKFSLKIGVFVQEDDVLVRERRRTNRIYTTCEKKTKTTMWIIPLGPNSAIAFISSSISSLCCLVEDEFDWLVSSEPDSWYRSPDARWSNET